MTFFRKTAVDGVSQNNATSILRSTEISHILFKKGSKKIKKKTICDLVKTYRSLESLKLFGNLWASLQEISRW